jgi:hypothetical protein
MGTVMIILDGESPFGREADGVGDMCETSPGADQSVLALLLC